MIKKKSNIKDVALEAGVSATTVSAYLNKTAPVNKKTAERIKESIIKLNYYPNLVARSLKYNKSRSIGIIFPDIENAFFTHIILKIEEIAWKNKYNVILCNTEHVEKKEKDYIELLKSKMVDGYLLISAAQSNEYLSEIMQNENVVYIDRNLDISKSTCVQVDNIYGMRLGIEYLLSLGHKKIGIINIPQKISPGVERFLGYKKVLEENNIEYNEKFVRNAGFSIESAYKESVDLLTSKDRPTALISAGILTSIGTLQAIKKLNIKIPKELSFVSFDEIDKSKLIDPPITIIAQPDYEIGKIAINLLLKKMNNVREYQNKTILVKPNLIIRKSCQGI